MIIFSNPTPPLLSPPLKATTPQNHVRLLLSTFSFLFRLKISLVPMVFGHTKVMTILVKVLIIIVRAVLIRQFISTQNGMMQFFSRASLSRQTEPYFRKVLTGCMLLASA